MRPCNGVQNPEQRKSEVGADECRSKHSLILQELGTKVITGVGCRPCAQGDLRHNTGSGKKKKKQKWQYVCLFWLIIFLIKGLVCIEAEPSIQYCNFEAYRGCSQHCPHCQEKIIDTESNHLFHPLRACLFHLYSVLTAKELYGLVSFGL